MEFTDPIPSFNRVLPECAYRYHYLEGPSYKIGDCTNTGPHVVNDDIADHVARIKYFFGTADISICGRTSSDQMKEALLLPFNFDDTLDLILQTATNGLSTAEKEHGFLKLMFGIASKSKRQPRYRLRASIGGLAEPEEGENKVSLKGREMLATRCFEIYMKHNIEWFHASGIELFILNYDLVNACVRYPDIERGFIEFYQGTNGQPGINGGLYGNPQSDHPT